MAYQGHKISIIAGYGGWNGNDNQARIPETHLIEAKNITFDGDAWRKMPGATPFDTGAVSGTPKLLGAKDYHPGAASSRIVTAWSNGKVYKETAGNIDAVELATGLTFTQPVVFVEGGEETPGASKHLFMFSDGVVPQVLTADGAAMAAIATPSTDWTGGSQPAGGLRFEGQLIAFAPSGAPHTIYGSTLTSHEDFTGSGSFAVAVWPGEGDRIAAVVPYLASDGATFLYVFKYPLGLYYVDLSDLTSILTYKVRDDIGMAGPRAWVRAMNDIFFQSSAGTIHSLTAVLTEEKIADSDISAKLNLRTWLKENVKTDRLRHGIAIYDEVRKEAKFAFTSLSDSDGGTPAVYTNGTALLVDVNDPANPRISLEQRGRILESLFTYMSTTGDFSIFGGGVGGLVYKFNQAARNVNGSAYLSSFRTIDTDLSFYNEEFASKEKRFDYLEMTVTPTGNYDLSVDIFLDGVLSETVALGLGYASGGIFGTAIFGTSTFGGEAITSHKVNLHGHAERIGIRGYNSSINEDFSISDLTIYCDLEGSKGVD